MSFRTDLIGVMANVLEILGPSGLDIVLNQLSIATRTWSGTRLHQGTSTDVTLVLPKKFPIKQLSTAEVSNSGGMYQVGDIIVSDITPSDGGSVGYKPSDLKPTITTNNQERVYIITGTLSGEYEIVELRSYRAFCWDLILRRRATTP